MYIIFKQNKGFSLIEMLIALAITSMLLVMFTQITFNFISLAQENYARSRFRESMTEVLDLIKRDIRNADLILNCEGSSCTITNIKKYIWGICSEDSESVCKTEVSTDQFGNTTFEVLKKTPDNIFIKSIAFEIIPLDDGQSQKSINSTVIVTVEAIPLVKDGDIEKARNGELLIDARQIIISTRNAKL